MNTEQDNGNNTGTIETENINEYIPWGKQKITNDILEEIN